MKNEQNPLYPIFLKLHKLNMLIVGAGEVGYEKISFMLKSSPRAHITMVAPWVNPEITELLDRTPEHQVTIIRKPFELDDLQGRDLVVAATNIPALNKEVHAAAKERGILINVADTPELCDFYLGSIVTRGDLKVAISTNGKSPTFAKRFRQLLEASLPEETSDLLDHLKAFRDTLGGDFEHKVKELNQLTASILEAQATQTRNEKTHS